MTERSKSSEGLPGRQDRRRVLQAVAGGGVLAALGYWAVALRKDDPETQQAAAEKLDDGRNRLPPGQHLIKMLKPMGGQAGDPSPSAFRLKVHGEVESPFEVTFAELLQMPQTEQVCDVHCVTTWSCLDTRWNGVRVADLAQRAGLKKSARHVIFEAAHGYTANVPLDEALLPTTLVAHRLNGDPLSIPNGPPVRALVPHLYFWKSAKWLTGVRFASADEPGFWELRGYNNHGDPWLEERYW